MDKAAHAEMEMCVWVDSLEREQVDGDPSANAMLCTLTEDPPQALSVSPTTFQPDPVDSQCISQAPGLEGSGSAA